MAEVTLSHGIGAGMKGPFIRIRQATVAATPQTVLFAPYKLKTPTNAYVLRDVGPNDTAGALTTVSMDANGITFTPASTGVVGLIIAEDILEK
jgi:hypothetical protein